MSFQCMSEINKKTNERVCNCSNQAVKCVHQANRRGGHQGDIDLMDDRKREQENGETQTGEQFEDGIEGQGNRGKIDCECKQTKGGKGSPEHDRFSLAHVRRVPAEEGGSKGKTDEDERSQKRSARTFELVLGLDKGDSPETGK